MCVSMYACARINRWITDLDCIVLQHEIVFSSNVAHVLYPTTITRAKKRVENALDRQFRSGGWLSLCSSMWFTARKLRKFLRLTISSISIRAYANVASVNFELLSHFRLHLHFKGTLTLLAGNLVACSSSAVRRTHVHV